MFAVLKNTEKPVQELEESLIKVMVPHSTTLSEDETVPRQSSEDKESAIARLLKVLETSSSAGSSANSSKSNLAMGSRDSKSSFLDPNEQKILKEQGKRRRKSRLGTTKYLEPKKEIDPDDRLVIFKQGSIILQTPGVLKIRGSNNKPIPEETFARLQDGNLFVYESQQTSSTSSPILSIPISNTLVVYEDALERLKLTVVEDKQVYYLKMNTHQLQESKGDRDAELEDWNYHLLEMSLRWGAVQRTELEHDIAATRKKVGELWELQGDKNIKVQKMIATLTAEIESKDSLLADIVSAQEELNIKVLYTRMKKKHQEELIQDEEDDAQSDDLPFGDLPSDDTRNLDLNIPVPLKTEISFTIDDYDAEATDKVDETIPSLPSISSQSVHPVDTNTSTQPPQSSIDSFRSFFPLIDMRRVSAVLRSSISVTPTRPDSHQNVVDVVIVEEKPVDEETIDTSVAVPSTSFQNESELNDQIKSLRDKETQYKEQIRVLQAKESDNQVQITSLQAKEYQYKEKLASTTIEVSNLTADIQEFVLRLGLAKTLNAKQAEDLNKCLDELQSCQSENTRLKQENQELELRLQSEIEKEQHLKANIVAQMVKTVEEKEVLLRDAETRIATLEEELKKLNVQLQTATTQQKEKLESAQTTYSESVQEMQQKQSLEIQSLHSEVSLIKSHLCAKETQFTSLLEDYSRQSTELSFSQSRIADLISTSTRLATDLQTLYNDKRFNIQHIKDSHTQEVDLLKEQVSLLTSQLSLSISRHDDIVHDHTSQTAELTDAKSQIKNLLASLQEMVTKDAYSRAKIASLQSELDAMHKEQEKLQEMIKGNPTVANQPSRDGRSLSLSMEVYVDNVIENIQTLHSPPLH